MSENIRCDTKIKYHRFPCEQLEYTKTVGKLLPQILGEIFTELGFKVKVNHQQANGVDIEVFLGHNRILVAEVLNWSIASRLTDKRKNSIIENLNEFNCNKMLIYTVPLSNLEGLEESGIYLLEIGYQILPEAYYKFFLTKHQVEKRQVDSDSARRNIRTKILYYVNNYLFGHKLLTFILSPSYSNSNNYREIAEHKDIPNGFLTRQINTAKKALEELPSCITHCPESSKCKKLLAYEEKLQALKEVMQPRLDRDVKDARKRLLELLSECRRLHFDIQKCIYVHKLLSRKGYHKWDL